MNTIYASILRADASSGHYSEVVEHAGSIFNLEVKVNPFEFECNIYIKSPKNIFELVATELDYDTETKFNFLESVQSKTKLIHHDIKVMKSYIEKVYIDDSNN